MKNIKQSRSKVYAVMFFWFLIQLPFAFSTSNGMGIARIKFNKSNSSSISYNGNNESLMKLELLYETLELSAKGLSEAAYDAAIKGYDQLLNNGSIANNRVITIIDFTQPSYNKRLFVIDVTSGSLLFNTLVAHGQNTGTAYANRFSNIPESFQSSLGFYITSKTYNGKNGFSMQLKGMEKGINDLAEQRAIVMHGAPYVSESFIRAKGYIGRSHGCPAVPSQLNKPIIENIKNGSVLFIYSNDQKYLRKSQLLAS